MYYFIRQEVPRDESPFITPRVRVHAGTPYNRSIVMDQIKRSGQDRREQNESVEQDNRNDNDRRETIHHHFRLVEVLEKIPLFKGLGLHQFKKILTICAKRTMLKDEALFHMGEESFEIFILLKGILKVTFENDKEFSRITPIGIVGEMGVFTGDHRSASIIAITDSLLLSIHKSELMRVLRTDADLSIHILMNVINDLSDKIRRDNRIMEDLRQVCPPGQWIQIITEAANTE